MNIRMLALIATVLVASAALADDSKENDPTAFLQSGKLVASVAGGAHFVDMEKNNAHVVRFSSITTNAKFSATKDIRWSGNTLRNCVDDAGKKLAAKTTSVALWSCEYVPEPPPPPTPKPIWK
jgi:hypothetical protein